MNNSEMDEFINEVRERSDIYAVVSRYIPMILKGGRYWACCPFHNEKTASFTINTEKGFFYCFGCHAGGNVFKFISKMENVSYFEAVRLQAERLGIPLPKKNKTSEEIAKERSQKVLFKIHEVARDFYHNLLMKTEYGLSGRKYLESRGITESTIADFKIGIAPSEWSRLTDELTRRGFSGTQIVEAGLSSPRKSGTGFYDRFRGRVMIPISDVFGHVVGFGGRILNDDEKDSPKYLNSPETKIFNKRNLLFGLDKTHLQISSSGFAIVVEGYMDAVSLFEAGVKNVVATLGTAFTAEHAKILMRYAKKIIFCYDSDEAGQRATVRALPIVRDAGAEVSVVAVPDGKDPDEFIRKHGRESFEKLIKNSVSLVDYRMNYILKSERHSTTREKIDVLRKILPIVAGVEDTALKNIYQQEIATSLVLDEEIVSSEWKKFLKSKKVDEKNLKNPKVDMPKKVERSKKSNEESHKENILIQRLGETILRMAWQESDTLGFVLSLVPKEAFTKVHREIIEYIEKCIEEERTPNDLTAEKELSEIANREISRILLAEEFQNSETVAFEDSVKRLRRVWLERRHAKLLQEAGECIATGDSAYVEKMQESLKIQKEMDNL